MPRRARHAPRCDCTECASLDLSYPGEGVQLALVLPTIPRRRARRPQQETFR